LHNGREIKFLRLAQVAEFPVKSIDAGSSGFSEICEGLADRR
jgi:hypothetical protein